MPIRRCYATQSEMIFFNNEFRHWPALAYGYWHIHLLHGQTLRIYKRIFHFTVGVGESSKTNKKNTKNINTFTKLKRIIFTFSRFHFRPERTLSVGCKDTIYLSVHRSPVFISFDFQQRLHHQLSLQNNKKWKIEPKNSDKHSHYCVSLAWIIIQTPDVKPYSCDPSN